MNKTLVVSMFTLALGGATLAYSTPSFLTGTELDPASMISAIANNTDLAASAAGCPSSDTTSGVPVSSAQANVANAVAVSGDTSIAVLGTDGSQQVVAGAVATASGIAIHGEENTVLAQSGNLADCTSAAGSCNQVVDQHGAELAQAGANQAVLKLTSVKKLEVEQGSAAVLGDGNVTTIANNSVRVKGELERDTAGVVAACAVVDSAFDPQSTDIDVQAKIDDSFNASTDKQSVSGQCGASTIVNANTLGDAATGTNLNITTATACVSAADNGNTSTGRTCASPADVSNACVQTIQCQAVVNYVTVNCSGSIHF